MRVSNPLSLDVSEYEELWLGIPRMKSSKTKKVRWVIDSFLPRKGLQLVYGAPGTRKTTFLLSAGWAVSQGLEFLGKPTLQRPVLYVDYENPADVMRSYCSDLGIALPSSLLSVWNRADAPSPLPGDSRLLDFVKRSREVTGCGPWIIFDSWTSLLKEGESGDKIGEATHIFRSLRRLCDDGATCTIVDHTGKRKSKLPIGTSAKLSQSDTYHYFQKVKDQLLPPDKTSARSVIRVESTLKRYAPKATGNFRFEVRAKLDETGNWHCTPPGVSKDIDALKNYAVKLKMRELIRENPNLGTETLCELADDIGLLSRDKSRDLLKEGTGELWKAVERGRRKVTYRPV